MSSSRGTKGDIVDFDYISENFLGFNPISGVPVGEDLFYDLFNLIFSRHIYIFIIIKLIFLLKTDIL